MPEETTTENQTRSTNGLSWPQWRQEVSANLEELDAALKIARQAIYRLRPMVRPKVERGQ
jgi:hypothetical protein